MTNETIADIVAEMRNHASGSAESAWYTPETWRQLCDRIEAAHDYWRAAMCAEVGASYQKEIMRRNYALLPIVNCEPKYDKDDRAHRLPIWDSTKCVEAVRAAQEIMKGETK